MLFKIKKKKLISYSIIIFAFFPLIPFLLYFSFYFLPNEHKPYIMNLKGEWKIHEGDNLEWAKKDFDDKNWKSFDVPGYYYRNGFRDNHCWIRKNFILNENMINENLFFMMGGMRTGVGEVYINGVQVGEIDLYKLKRKIDGFNSLKGFMVESHYFNKIENTIALRLHWIELGSDGIRDSRLYLGVNSYLKRYYVKNNFLNSFFQIGIIFFSIFAFILMIVFTVSERKSKNRYKYISTGLIILASLFYEIGYSAAFIAFSFDIFLLSKIKYISIVFVCFAAFEFYEYYFLNRVDIVAKINRVVCVLFAFLFLVLPNIPFLSFLYYYFLFYFFAVVLYAVFISLRDVFFYKKQQYGLIVASTIVIAALSGIADIFINFGILNMPKTFNVNIASYSIAATAVIILEFLSISFTNNKLTVLLKELNANLERKVEKRTREIEEVNRQKTTFFINLAHETKTPLTLISNYFEKYMKKMGKNDSLIIIKQNIDILKRNMVNFLDLEKIERGQVFYNHEQIVNLSETLRKKLVLFKGIAEKKEIKLSYDIKEDIYTKIDPFAIDRIINNLIDNAIKYTPETGNIKVKLFTEMEKIKLIVEDTGIGISDEHKEKIFLPYHQISHAKRNIQGIGMGLYIVFDIIKSINGNIDIMSKLKEGTKFIITLDKYQLLPGDKIEDINVSKPLDTVLKKRKIQDSDYSDDKATILVVEDNINLLSYLKDELSQKYNIYVSLNGKEALFKLKSIPRPSLILSDIMMDEMDGYEFYTLLSDSEEYKGVPFIFLTAKTSPDDKLKGLREGAIDFISKPFSIEELIAKIESVLLNYEKHRLVVAKDIEGRIINAIYEKGQKEKKLKNNLEQKFIELSITKREKEIVFLLVNGSESKEISDELGISVNTVLKHIQNIYKKFNVQNKIELYNILKSD